MSDDADRTPVPTSGFPGEDVEPAPLDVDAAALRRARLVAAGGSGKPEVATKALLGAARISEALGDAADAKTRYEGARLATPTSAPAMRGLGRLAERAGDFVAAARWARERLGLSTSPDERREILLFCAEVELVRAGDAVAAAATLEEAERLGADPRLPFARAEAAYASGRASGVPSALGGAKAEGPLAAALAGVRAAEADRAGDAREALGRWREAERIDPTAAPLVGALARTGVAGGDPGAQADAWRKMALGSPPGGARTSALLHVGRIQHLAERDPKAALETLADLPSTIAVETARLDAAEDAADAAAVVRAASALATLAPGRESAAALWRAGRALVREERAEAALQTFEEALALDPELAPARVEVDLARRLQGAAAIADALGARDRTRAAAARLAAADVDAEGRAAARADLVAAREGEATSAAGDLVSSALAAAAGEGASAAADLGRLAGAAKDDNNARAIRLAQATVLERAGLDATAAYEAALPDPAAGLAVRRRAANLAGPAATAARAAAEAAEGAEARAAAAMDEAAALERAGDPGAAFEAWTLVLALDPEATRAAAARARLAASGAAGDAAAALRDLAAAAPDAVRAAPMRVRAALRFRESDRTAAGFEIRAALAASPDDVSLAELAASLGEGAEAKARAHQARLGESPTVPTLVAAAEAFESASLYEDAADLFRRACELEKDRADLETAYVDALVRAGELTAVTEHLLAEVREHPEGVEHAAALERLADFDGGVRGDSASAAIAWSEVVAAMPGHAAGLRALERHLAGSGRREDVLPILEALVDATGDPEDAAAFARRASRIKRLEVGPIGIEDAELAKKALARRPSSWALAALDADARARRDDEALASIAGRRAARAVGPSAAAHAVAAAEALLRLGRTDDALAATKGALEADPRHPLALARAVELGLATGDLSLAASALETSGDAAGDPARGARDLFHAATLAEGRLGDAERALAILERAVVRDPSHAEATERAARLLEQFGRISDAEALLASRFALGGEPAALVRIAEHRADLLLNLEMREEARASLRAAVALRPDDLALQWRIAEIAGEDGAHAERAEALIQIARVVTDPAEVKTVFLDLGRLYDGPLPDPARAEASFRRVLQHDPNHLEALSHLASIGMALGNWQLALDATERLVSLSTSAPEKAKHLRALCRIHDQGFQNPRKAEAALQEARRIHPRDPETIDAGAAFYKAHGGGPPLLMWLDLAASALRDSVADTPAEPDAYRALARSLELRGRRDATRATLAVLDAIGEASQRERLGLGGYGATATTALLDGATGDLVAPSGLPTSLREVFARMADGFASLASTDPREHGAAKADRLSPRDPPRMAAQKIARELGLPDLEVYAIATGRRPDVVLPGDPPVLVTTRAGLGGADDAEAAFRAGRAAWLARNRLAAPLLHSDADLGLLLLGLVRQFDARFPVDADEAAVEEAGRRIGRHIPRRERDAILPFALEAAGSRALDGATVRGAIAAAADAAGLLVCGRIDAALRAVAKDAGVGGPKQAAATPRGSRLLSFAVSEPYFEARRLAGIA